MARVKHVIEMNQNDRIEMYHDFVKVDTILTDLINDGQNKDIHNSLLAARRVIRDAKELVE